MSYFLLFRIIPTILCIQLASFFGGVRFVEGAARFTETPRSVLHVFEGDDAYFIWDYHVDDRGGEFDVYSPKWSFYENTTVSKGIDIAFDNQVKGWAWEIASTCPPRLLNPTRVRKDSTATLVISKVTTADNGIYGCSLVFQLSQKTEKTQLIVVVIPKINVDESKKVLENDDLTVNCSAIGIPTPNVTWIKDGRVLAFGVNGNAVLKIYNINRDQSGKYECQAMNNPDNHTKTATKQTIITVQFPAEFDKEHSYNKSVKAYLGERNVELKSAADGVPVPTHVWFLPNKKMVKSETLKKSTYIIEVVKQEHIGNWTVNVTNGIGSSYVHRIELLKVSKHDFTDDCTTGVIAGFVIGLIIAVVIIVVLAVVIVKRKKEKKEWATWEKALIIIGFIVAIVIIIVVIVFIVEKCV